MSIFGVTSVTGVNLEVSIPVAAHTPERCKHEAGQIDH